ncbi:AraC family transcriptional regulator [Variovorax sp. PCZ-1]|nr:AraC family transcriptional regulator [Variovorax sp. PCZ-1]
MDRLSTLLERFRVHAQLSFAGAMCGKHVFSSEAQTAYLHVLRSGSVEIRHPGVKGLPKHITLNEPSLIFYPRPLTHHFLNAPEEGSQFTCAEISFEGGQMHPIVQALPSLVLLKLSDVHGLQDALNLLFAETQRVQCGQRVLADRLFEVVLIQLLRWLLDHPTEAKIDSGLLMGLSSPQLAKALTAMHESPGAPWTVEQLADASGMSRTAFATKFKATVGISPAQYLADWRLTLVQSRLKEGASLKTLALELGYSSQSALTRAFTQRLGFSPRQWLGMS